jgi:hypothetical protein
MILYDGWYGVALEAPVRSIPQMRIAHQASTLAKPVTCRRASRIAAIVSPFG